MAALATVPRSAGNGAALIVVALNGAIALMAALEKAVSTAQATPVPAKARRARKSGIWHLYRVAGSGDSVPPQILEYLQD